MNQQIKECLSTPENEQSLIALLDRLENQNENKATIEFRMNSYLDFKARKKGIPIKGTFELTPLCNLDCKMCYVHLTEQQLSCNSKSLLTGSQWKQIIDQAVDHGMLYALLTGGEAMLHPDFEDIYLHLQSRGVNVSINTNGLLLTEKRIAFFKKHMPRELHITLYGADEDTYEKVTGHRVYGKVIDAIQRAKDAGILLYINITPNRYMVNGIDKLVGIIQSKGIKYGINSSLSEPRAETGRGSEMHDMSLEEYIQMYKRLSLLEGKKLIPVPEYKIPQPGGNMIGELKGFLCGGGRSSFSVVWNGIMQPCLTFCNIRADLTRMLFAEAWTHIHQSVKEYPIPIECHGCPYEKICPVCVARHEEGALPGHANPKLCEKAKMLFGAGLVSLT